MKRCSNKLTIDQIASLINVESIDVYYEKLIDCFFCEVEGCEHDSDRCPEVIARDEAMSKYIEAIEFVFRDLCEKHGLELIDNSNCTYKVEPSFDWNSAANEIRITIEGYGLFYFGNLKEFLSSGPYTARSAVLNHLHWLKEWYDVYEGGKAKERVYRRMR